MPVPAITGWLRELFGSADNPELIVLAEASGPGACGIIAGLTLSHTKSELYRAALEATALGVRIDGGEASQGDPRGPYGDVCGLRGVAQLYREISPATQERSHALAEHQRRFS